MQCNAIYVRVENYDQGALQNRTDFKVVKKIIIEIWALTSTL